MAIKYSTFNAKKGAIMKQLLKQMDQKRKEADWALDRAKKWKRLAMLFSIVDALIIIKIVYNCIAGPYLDNPTVPVFWGALLITAGAISIYLSVRLWLYERRKKKELLAIAEKKKKILFEGKVQNGLLD